LLVALVVTALVVGAALGVMATTRTALDVEPAALDASRRLRDGVERFAGAVRGAGGALGAGSASTAFEKAVPRVWPLTRLDGSGGETFEAVWFLHAIETATGRVSSDQPAPAASLTLDAAPPCPLMPGVCGFEPGDVAVVFDERGHMDVFEVGAISLPLMRVTPASGLKRPYRAGAWLARARADRLGARTEPDGSRTLVRLTWAGATEPLIDGVVGVRLAVWGEGLPPLVSEADEGPGFASYGLAPLPLTATDPDGRWADGEHCMVALASGRPVTRLDVRGAGEDLVELAPADLNDGPWCPDAVSEGGFDADLFRIRRVDVHVRVEATSPMFRGPVGRLFVRPGTARSPLRWVPDREAVVSIALRSR
jgi:hypothetical protein